MDIQKAIQYFQDEIDRCRRAPDLNGCPMREEWQETIDACQIALEAICRCEGFSDGVERMREAAVYKIEELQEGCLGIQKATFVIARNEIIKLVVLEEE